MGTLNKLRMFLNLDGRTMFRFFEAFFYLGLARLLIILFPFSRIAPLLGIQMQETGSSDESNRLVLFTVYEAIRIMSEHTFWESKCLVRAIAAMKMLERRGVESTLYLGTARDEKGQLIAHAWLRSGIYIVTGAEGMERFSVVGKFAKMVKK